MKNSNNPLSPHLQIYKWQLSSLISIFHRITSIINTISKENQDNFFLYICHCLVYAAFNIKVYTQFEELMGDWDYKLSLRHDSCGAHLPCRTIWRGYLVSTNSNFLCRNPYEKNRLLMKYLWKFYNLH